VSDSGPGIAPGDLARIFEPFERGDPARTRLVPGTGLGLTIVKMLSQLMGGDVTVKSTPGAGSAFEVRLMLATAPKPASLPPPARRITGYAGLRRTILAVDDDADQRDLVRQILEPLGFAVVTATDGRQCLTLARDLKPDLFLLDISMPGMSGWELARALRDAGQAGAILMLSANAGVSQPAPAESAAHDDVMAKPFEVRRLLDRVQALLGLAWIEEGMAEAAAVPAGLAAPAAEHLDELLQLGRIGYVRGIEGKLDQLEAEPGNREFVAEVRTHLRSFDFRRYTALIEAARGHG
jgi:CheY-like chemotaxis protein